MWQEFKQNWKESWRFTTQGWKSFRLIIFNRYWLLWMLNYIIAMQFLFWLNRVIEFKFILVLVFIIGYFSLSPLSLLLWLPQYLAQKKPHLYRGVIKSIGDWIGKPYPHLNR